jgi:hypothetical protein
VEAAGIVSIAMRHGALNGVNAPLAKFIEQGAGGALLDRFRAAHPSSWREQRKEFEGYSDATTLQRNSH